MFIDKLNGVVCSKIYYVDTILELKISQMLNIIDYRKKIKIEKKIDWLMTYLNVKEIRNKN